MFCFFFPFSYSWLKEWKLRADREERKKQTDKKLEEGSNGKELIKIYIAVILLFKKVFISQHNHICGFRVCLSILTLAFWVQTQTGTVESWTPWKERTCVTLCSSPDPPELARRLQSTLVRRSWASRYIVRDCDALWNGCHSFLTSLWSPHRCLRWTLPLSGAVVSSCPSWGKRHNHTRWALRVPTNPPTSTATAAAAPALSGLDPHPVSAEQTMTALLLMRTLCEGVLQNELKPIKSEWWLFSSSSRKDSISAKGGFLS